ncbi:MAG: 4-(cytidine 5'-diphospho)-2-C-methyl-D-erythritol kinase, partial [Mycobacterium sp.]
FLCSSAQSAADVAVELSALGAGRAVRVASGPVYGARVVPSSVSGA